MNYYIKDLRSDTDIHIASIAAGYPIAIRAHRELGILFLNDWDARLYYVSAGHTEAIVDDEGTEYNYEQMMSLLTEFGREVYKSYNGEMEEGGCAADCGDYVIFDTEIPKYA